MAQLGEAIARYHKLFEEDGYRDLSWAEELQERMRERRLTESGRLVAPILRPQFISRRQLEMLSRAAEHLAAILDHIEALTLQSPSLLNRLQMLPAEKMLAAIPTGCSRFSVAARIDAHLQNGSISLRGFETCKPKGLAYSEQLADLFLDLPIMKTFKRGRYRLSKVGHPARLRSAVLQAWKEFGGRRQPKIAILEIGDQFGSDPTEGYILAERFNAEGLTTCVVSPYELSYSAGKLRAGDFEIDVVFRRLLTRELLARFDLSHPLLLAYRDHAVCVVNDFRSEIAHRRALFELLTDENVTAGLPLADRKLIRAFVPWTRVVGPRKTKYKDRDVDLPQFILENRERLALRPNEDLGDQRTFIGSEMHPSAWEGALRVALRTPYVVQERLSNGSEPFPVFQYGELQMKRVAVSVHPHIFNGKMQGASAALVETSSAGCVAPLAMAPVLVLGGQRLIPAAYEQSRHSPMPKPNLSRPSISYRLFRCFVLSPSPLLKAAI